MSTPETPENPPAATTSSVRQTPNTFWAAVDDLNKKISNNLVWFAASMIVVGVLGTIGMWTTVAEWARDAAVQELHNNAAVQAQIKSDVDNAVEQATHDDSVAILVGARIRKDTDFMADLVTTLRMDVQLMDVLKGVPGEQGRPGPQGKQGVPGPQGVQGAQGSQGPQGVSGPQGETGVPGRDGTDGAKGADGAPGAPGAAGVCTCP
jgi:hypothetical protein